MTLPTWRRERRRWEILMVRTNTTSHRSFISAPSSSSVCKMNQHELWRSVVFCRVHQHTRAVLQHLLHVLSDRSGHVAGLLPAPLLQGQEAHWVKSACKFRDPELLPDIRTSGPWHFALPRRFIPVAAGDLKFIGSGRASGNSLGRDWCVAAKLSFSVCTLLIQACSVSFGKKITQFFFSFFFLVFILNDSTSPYNW